MAVTTTLQPQFIVDTYGEIDTAWPDGSFVFCKANSRMYIINNSTIYQVGGEGIGGGGGGDFVIATNDTDDITEGATNKFATASEKTKIGHLSVTQAVDLDAMESDLAGKAALPILVATLAGDAATGANTTPIDLTNLVFTYAANSVYRIWFMGQVSPAAATTGCGFQFNLSSAVTDISIAFFHQLASTGSLSGGHSIADDASVGVSSGLPGTSTYPVIGHGILRTTGNTGTAQLRFRSETTAVITAKAGLTLVVEKIA